MTPHRQLSQTHILNRPLFLLIRLQDIEEAFVDLGLANEAVLDLVHIGDRMVELDRRSLVGRNSACTRRRSRSAGTAWRSSLRGSLRLGLRNCASRPRWTCRPVVFLCWARCRSGVLRSGWIRATPAKHVRGRLYDSLWVWFGRCSGRRLYSSGWFWRGRSRFRDRLLRSGAVVSGDGRRLYHPR